MAEGKWAAICKVCRQRYRWEKFGPDNKVPPCPFCAAKAAKKVMLEAPAADEVREVLEMAEELIRMCEEDVCEAGEEFAASVADTARDIIDTIERTKEATARQREAIENMTTGVERWIHD
jgi:hypothetical protein